ncbi:MAG TPA: trypsin-like serine protease [Micromonosporaceae bacterium]|jgi:hypothetical protein
MATHRPRHNRAAFIAGVGLALICTTTGCTPTGSTQPIVDGSTGSAQPIIGGTPTFESDVPFFVEIEPGSNFPIGASPTQCGGSVIGPALILTAAHCLEAPDGTIMQNSMIAVRTSVGVGSGRIVVDPRYGGSVNDLAIINLVGGTSGQNVSLTEGIQPVQVGDPGNSALYAAGRPAKIMGTGMTHQTGPLVQFNVASTTIRSNDDMADVYDNMWSTAYMIGAGDATTTICRGDSGGPLVVTTDAGRSVQVGVARGGSDDCADPGMFMRLDGAQLAWVASVAPTVQDAWTTCTTAVGAAGRYVATWGGSATYGPHQDGPAYWNIRCQTANALRLQVRHSGLCADVAPADGNLVQGPCDGAGYDLVEVSRRADGYYRMVVPALGQCLGVVGNSLDVRALVHPSACSDSDPSQAWAIRPTDDSYFLIVSHNSGQCLDVEGDYVGPGARVWQYTCDLGANQQFRFVKPADCPGDSDTPVDPRTAGDPVLGEVPNDCGLKLPS